MKDPAASEEKRIGALLSVGSSLGLLAVSAGTTIGLMLPGTGRVAEICNVLGVALFVLLPVARVILMAALFVRKDRVIFGAALTVLGIIGAASAGFIALHGSGS